VPGAAIQVAVPTTRFEEVFLLATFDQHQEARGSSRARWAIIAGVVVVIAVVVTLLVVYSGGGGGAGGGY